MINGHGSYAQIALRIVEDFTHKTSCWEDDPPNLRDEPIKRLNGYTLPQFHEVVMNQKRSIVSLGAAPSYIWWYISVNRYGEAEPVIDMGKRSPNIITKKNKRAYWSRMHMMVYAKIENEGKWGLVIPLYELHGGDVGEELMLRYGLSYGQHFLTRYEAAYYTSNTEYEETDILEKLEVIYASVPRFHDIPFSVPNIKPEFRGFRT